MWQCLQCLLYPCVAATGPILQTSSVADASFLTFPASHSYFSYSIIIFVVSVNFAKLAAAKAIVKVVESQAATLKTVQAL